MYLTVMFIGSALDDHYYEITKSRDLVFSDATSTDRLDSLWSGQG